MKKTTRKVPQSVKTQRKIDAAESWLQLELFGKVWCFSRKKIDVTLRF